MSDSCQATSSMRVLLAEDHPMNRAIIEIMLEAIGADLTAVEDGLQAVEAFRRQRFDIVLMDIQMPVMDGLTAIREVRRFEADTGLFPTPILAVTANALSEHVQAARAAGADMHIAKPIIPDDLLRTMTETVARHAVMAEAQAPAAARG
jgi:CheY-like chemotaxis protein